MTKVTEKKNDKSNLFIQEGESFFKVGKFEDALECFEKVLSINQRNWKALNSKGCCLMKLNRVPEAKLCFDESLKIDDSKSESWGCLGTYYLQIDDNEHAKKYFNKAEQLEGNELAYSQLAYFFYTIEDHHKAELYVERALSLNNKNESALNTKGLLYIHHEDLPSAIEIFRTLIGMNSSNSVYHSNLGYAYFLNKNILEARKALDDSISLNPSNAYALNNSAILYHSQSDYLTAWNYIEKAVSINPKVLRFWGNKADILISLIKSGDESFGTFQDVGYFLYRADLSTVDVMISLSTGAIELSKEERDQILIGMINMDNFFTQTVNDSLVSREDYLNIYKMSLETVALLGASRPEEFSFAHYTTQDTANALIFQNSQFRLNSVTTANDPKEGYPLLNFLGFTGAYSPNIYQAFVGSFTFNPDSLNQFRLYGKNNNIEGSGVSLILSFEYFADNADLNKGLTTPLTDNLATKETTKQPLFRCIYIDPLSRRVISLGHKEACVFYRENIGVERSALDEKVDNYLKFINELTRKVEDSLINLNDKISILYDKIKDNDDQRKEIFKIIPMLLIHLRYLVKHYDFKEEQECRIIQVEPLIKNQHVKLTSDNNRMYIDYLPFHSDDKSYLREIYWGPKTSNFELFKDRVMHLGMNIFCMKNDHPFT
ncbi:MAG TPA: tetratricopeptide repeat protein [Parapedobacter sp.]|uniref:tetratricopeptide repeat protein n=1 Tax=Parapedobacter sp. TaxID=1958893 RepID=UPI002CB9B6AF|nr:tetratricopeptide repeat protein [Parapedobacter sp.]HWK57316.1 tetratricopeptide repeat protein [Parapedobacter sp.]